MEALFPQIEKHYAGYAKYSIEGLVERYATIKFIFIKHADYHAQVAEKILLEYSNEAEECLWYIQQKKLFNLQCQWRAGKIKLVL